MGMKLGEHGEEHAVILESSTGRQVRTMASSLLGPRLKAWCSPMECTTEWPQLWF